MRMIYIGLTGWGDHDSLYPPGLASKDKLQEYAAHFPTVEVDSYFYAIQPQQNVEKWICETPDAFRFIVKAYQGMTGHERGEIPYSSKEEMFAAFLLSIAPFLEAKKLAMVLFQFPPWFDCRREHVAYLRWCREKMGDVPVALEFRHQSWFWPRFYEKTLKFMETEGWIHSICDEPQAGEGSVPAVLHPTNREKTLIRFHGRNVHGWNKATSGENWRAVRYLYRYREDELREWVHHIRRLQKQTNELYILFNNNSGGDAADNAKQLLQMLGIEYTDLAPRQLDLF
ncbi:hypothetical protein GFC29_2262 [Anoxybacillus sp. B7M1]|nr:hypothetical protein GFC28_3172 [Anoxybacillus sp. B2M1]ANB63491.1 hypothetical protein GFC29_2262 [Anoxybacillus sp. B7M1]